MGQEHADTLKSRGHLAMMLQAGEQMETAADLHRKVDEIHVL